MVRKAIIAVFKVGLVATVLFLLLFADRIFQAGGFLTPAGSEILAVLHDPGTQWMVFLCLGIYFFTFVLIEHRAATNILTNRNTWLAGLVLIAAVVYARNYVHPIEAVTLLGGIVAGRAAGFLKSISRGSRQEINWGAVIPCLLLLLLAVASIWPNQEAMDFEYRNHQRWVGPWKNPNEFGLLMGTGVVLAVGIGLTALTSLRNAASRTQKWRSALGAFGCVVALVFTSRGLAHSLSRGAWLATACGLTYLSVNWFGRPCLPAAGPDNASRPEAKLRRILPFSRNAGVWVIIAASLMVIAFWQFRQTNWIPARRAFSAANANDFSWRNRVASWNGALQIIAEHPWLGAGWGRPESLYEHYYIPARLGEGAAIQMNDYFTIAVTLGIPALVCFAMYLGWTLTGHRRPPQSNNYPTQAGPSSLRCCLNAAIVPLIGFWFDGGLFKLAIATVFWVLSEMGATRPEPAGANHFQAVRSLRAGGQLGKTSENSHARPEHSEAGDKRLSHNLALTAPAPKRTKLWVSPFCVLDSRIRSGSATPPPSAERGAWETQRTPHF